jgi:WD40 repeat protein
MARYDRVLIDPGPAALDAALVEAAAALNRRARGRQVAWPPPDYPAFQTEFAAAAEGFRQWTDSGVRSWVTRTALALAWWTDFGGRRHCRVAGLRDRLSRPQLLCLLDPTARPRVPLTLVYPNHAFLRRLPNRCDLVAWCACGAFGGVERLGWMGTCCGPCHDRREDGQEPPHLWPDPVRATLQGGTGSLYNLPFLALSADGRVATGSHHHPVVVGDLSTGQGRLAPLPHSGRPDRLLCAAFAPAGRHLLTADRDGRVERWDLQTGTAEVLFTMPRGWIYGLAVSPDDGRVAVFHVPAGGQRGVWVWDADTGQMRQVLAGLSGGLGRVAFSPDGTLLAAANERGSVRLRNVVTGAELPGPRGSGGEAGSLSFSPDGRTLAVVVLPHLGMRGPEQAHPIQLWDVAEGRLRTTLPGESPLTYTAAFAPDGALVAGDEYGRLSVWEMEARRLRLTLEWHRRPVLALTFSSDGRMLASLDQGGTVKVWPAEVLRPVEAADLVS